jgi:hypothetical protein
MVGCALHQTVVGLIQPVIQRLSASLARPVAQASAPVAATGQLEGHSLQPAEQQEAPATEQVQPCDSGCQHLQEWLQAADFAALLGIKMMGVLGLETYDQHGFKGGSKATCACRDASQVVWPALSHMAVATSTVHMSPG